MRPLSFRKKNQIMGVTATLLLLLILSVSVRKTFTLVRSNTQLEQRTSLAARAPEQIARLQVRSSQLGEVLAIGGEEGTLRKELFEKVGTYCQQYQVRLQSLQEAETFEEDHLQVATHEVQLEGSFANQLRVCNALEKHLRRGRVTSLLFRTVYDRRTKQTYLNGQLFIQGVSEKKSEKL